MNDPLCNCSRVRGSRHRPDCPARCVKHVYIRWNKGLLRTMPDAPKNCRWTVSLGKLRESDRELGVAAGLVQVMWDKDGKTGAVIAWCQHTVTKDMIVTPFQIGEVKTVWKKLKKV